MLGTANALFYEHRSHSLDRLLTSPVGPTVVADEWLLLVLAYV